MKLLPILLGCLVVGGSAIAGDHGSHDLVGQVRDRVRARFMPAGRTPGVSMETSGIRISAEHAAFYGRREYRPAWSDGNGPRHEVGALVRALGQARGHGLRPEHYHLTELEQTLSGLRQAVGAAEGFDAGNLTDFDLLCTDAFLVYASHLVSGRIRPRTIDPQWHAARSGKMDFAAILEKALASGDIEGTLEELAPAHPCYRQLRRALAQVREMQAHEGWPQMPSPQGRKMQKGDRGPEVAALRRRLFASGDLDPGTSENAEVFDDNLDAGVRNFQWRHGLVVDGVVGPATREALDVSVKERIRQMEVNLERWRWLPEDLGPRHILVNIANYELQLVENGHPVLTMRAVVGKTYRKTPVFSAKMTYLVINPHWNIPTKIAVEDKLPLVQKDPQYFTKERIRVFQATGPQAREMDPWQIDWRRVTAKGFAYRLRQDPGPWNALGRIKFMFPNDFDVYIHDTPSRELFAKTDRGYSSGCIRIERPIDLAVYLLRGNPRWTAREIFAAIEAGTERTVVLPEPVTVHILYCTSWVTDDGSLHFRKDIYGRDRLVEEAMGTGR